MTPPFLAAAPVQTLLALLGEGGEEARVVGGAVRNHLMGVPVADIDIAATPAPLSAKARLEAAGIKVVPTGLAHGTITAVMDKIPYEITSLREDVATDGRRARVAFGRDFKTDAGRRDFTVNALSMDKDGRLYDYFGGEADAKARRIRFIGDPQARIREDYLRILRFFRFSAHYGAGELDADGLKACVALKDGLYGLSRERVRAEMLKLLAAPDPAPTLEAMAEGGILALLLPQGSDPARLRRMMAIETGQGLAVDPLRRLAALAAMTDRDSALTLRAALRLSNGESRRLETMAEAGPLDAGDMLALKTLLYHVGARNYADRLVSALLAASEPVDAPHWHRALMLPRAWSPPPFPVSGHDLMALGMAQGPDLGAALAHLRQRWMMAGFPASKAQTLALL